MRYEDLIAAARIARSYAAAVENRLPRDMSTREAEEAILEAERVADLLEAEAASEPTESGRTFPEPPPSRRA